jgi:sulfur dioxygenase
MLLTRRVALVRNACRRTLLSKTNSHWNGFWTPGGINNGTAPATVQELNYTDCKTYLITCRKSKMAAIIDPVHDRVPLYLSILAYHRLTLAHCIETHTHADHETGSIDLAAVTQCDISMHESSPSPLITQRIKGGSIIQVGTLPLHVLSTPGHTPDSVCFYISPEHYTDSKYQGVLFSGDALLVEGTGRTDFAGGNAEESYDSVKFLFGLPEKTLVLPGHDYKGKTHTDIGHERVHNPRVAKKSREEYVKLMKELFDSRNLPEKIQQVLQVNQAGMKPHVRRKVSFPKLNDIATIKQISPQELIAKMVHDDSSPLLIDLREDREIKEDGLGMIPGAQAVPLEELQSFIKTHVSKESFREVVCICRVGIRSNSAAAMLASAGIHRVANLKGGMLAWNDFHYPTE